VRTTALALFALAGCIDEFRGSNVQIDFAPAMPIQASVYGTQRSSELPHNIHFTLYAFDEMADSAGNIIGRLFEVQQFEIHRVVDLESPCFIDVGEHVPIEGLHVSMYAEEIMRLNGITDLANPGNATEAQQIDAATAVQRQRNAEAMASDAGPKAITSASPGGYGVVATSCTDPNGIPPPECVEAEANARRLAKCQTEWENDRFYFEGTDRVLTAPLNGTTFGMVQGMNPVNLAPIGGSAFFVDEALEDFDGYALYWQYDDINPRDGMPDYPPAVPASERTKLGVLYMFGRPEPASRGVIHTHLVNSADARITAELAVFANIHEDSVHF
jgi:hypothetical protein